MTREAELRKRIKEELELWRKANWKCCEDEEKGVKPCHYDEHGKDIVNSILEYFNENSFYEYLLTETNSKWIKRIDNELAELEMFVIGRIAGSDKFFNDNPEIIIKEIRRIKEKLLKGAKDE